MRLLNMHKSWKLVKEKREFLFGSKNIWAHHSSSWSQTKLRHSLGKILRISLKCHNLTCIWTCASKVKAQFENFRFFTWGKFCHRKIFVAFQLQFISFWRCRGFLRYEHVKLEIKSSAKYDKKSGVWFEFLKFDNRSIANAVKWNLGYQLSFLWPMFSLKIDSCFSHILNWLLHVFGNLFIYPNECAFSSISPFSSSAS